MLLTHVRNTHIKEIMSWFLNEEEVHAWAGPNFRYPYDFNSFKKGLKLDEINSFVLLADDNTLMAFGQFYLRIGRCHLGRLVVNPEYCGGGIVATLITQLSELGQLTLATQTCSLFVLAHNKSAIKAYKKLGFVLADYPEPIPLANCLYMTKTPG